MQRKFTDMPATTQVIKEAEACGAKDKAQQGLSFKDKNGVDYVFNNEDENEMVEDRSPPSPFPDILAEAPGIMLEREFNAGVDKVIQDKLVRGDEEWARLAAENLGLHFDKPCNFDQREVIKNLDGNDEDILEIGYTKQENIPPKVEDTPTDMIDLSACRWANGRPQLTDGPFGNFREETVADTANSLQCSSQGRTATKRFKDYELYVTVGEEEEMLMTSVGDNGVVDEDKVRKEDELATVVHYIMMHYAKNKTANPKQKKCYKPQARQFGLTAGLRQFGDKGEVAITKELKQFNTHNVFDPVDAKDLTVDDRKNALSSLIF